MAIQCCFERYEKKYCLTLSQQRFLLERMTPYMKKDAYGEYTICNIYYDTDAFRLICASLEKPIYKEKLRVRSYGVPQEDGKVFVELKKKFDGVVYKRRITTGIQNVEPFLSGELPSENFGQIGREIGYFQSFYHTVPKVFIGYDRLAFAGIDDPQLRITFDTNLRWRDTDVDLRLGDHGAPIALPCGDVLMDPCGQHWLPTPYNNKYPLSSFRTLPLHPYLQHCMFLHSEMQNFRLPTYCLHQTPQR